MIDLVIALMAPDSESVGLSYQLRVMPLRPVCWTSDNVSCSSLRKHLPLCFHWALQTRFDLAL
jgi:hypothetical protein